MDKPKDTQQNIFNNIYEQFSRILNDELISDKTNLQMQEYYIRNKMPSISYGELKNELISFIFNNNLANNYKNHKILNMLQKNNIPITIKSILPYIDRFIEYNKPQTIESDNFKNTGTFFELKDYFVQTVEKGHILNTGKIYNKDEPGIQFYLKTPQMNYEQYYSLNDFTKSFFACKNDQFIEKTPFNYTISKFLNIEPTNNHFGFTAPNIKNNKYPFLSKNEFNQLYNIIKKLHNQNFDWSRNTYIAISDEPYTINAPVFIMNNKYTNKNILDNQLINITKIANIKKDKGKSR